MNRIIKADLYRYLPEVYNIRTLLKGFREPGFFYTYLIRNATMHRKYSFGTEEEEDITERDLLLYKY